MRKFIIAAWVACGLAASPAYADHGYYRGGHHGRHGGDDSAWVGLAVVGAIAGLALLANQTAPAYAAPASVEPAYPPPQPSYPPPAAYSVPAPAAPGTLFYCPSSNMYYPNTRACPEGWEAVPASPY